MTYPSQTAPPPDQKGVGAWSFAGVQQALAASKAKWYYNWRATPGGIATPPGMQFVPMIWGSSQVKAATLSAARREGRILLGFNEPDVATQANMSVSQALDLWPQLMATGMTLGSPAVFAGAASSEGWLGRFMAGVKARGYRVDFITVHWYGSDFDTAAAVKQLQSYLQSVHDRYRRPIWLTEFALVDWLRPEPAYASANQQTAFLSAAASMLAALPYVHRYAWFALPADSLSGSAGLFQAGAVATAAGRAFESAPLQETCTLARTARVAVCA